MQPRLRLIHPEREQRRLSNGWKSQCEPPPPPEKRIPVRHYPLIARVEGSDTHYLKLPNMTEEKRFRTWASALRFFEEHAEAAGVRRRQPTERPSDEGYDDPPPSRKSGKRPQRDPSPKPKSSKRPRAKRDAPNTAPSAPVDKVPCEDEPLPPPLPEPMEEAVSWSTKQEVIFGTWLAREDLALAAAVSFFGPEKWPRICQYVPGRTPKQCRERWFDRLDPKLKHGSFSDQEDEMVLRGVDELGHKWSEIAKRIPGRTGSACKNRWTCLSKPKAAIGGHRGCRWSQQECLRLARAVELHNVGTSLALCVWDKVAESVATRPAHSCRARWVCHATETLERARAAEAHEFVNQENKLAEKIAEQLAEGIVDDLDKDFGEEPHGPFEEQPFDEDEDRAFAEMLSFYAEDPMYGLLAVEELPPEEEDVAEPKPEPAWTRSARLVVGQPSGVAFHFDTYRPEKRRAEDAEAVRAAAAAYTLRWTGVGTAGQSTITDFMRRCRWRPPREQLPAPCKAGGPAAVPSATAARELVFVPCPTAC